MTIDQAGLDFILEWEGYRQFPYRDLAGLWTVGIGHKILSGEDFSSGLTEAQALVLLAKDVAPVSTAVDRLAPLCNQNQHNALCDFGFNLGVGALETMLGHGVSQVPQQTLRWDHVGGLQVKGLVLRRKAEVALFQIPDSAKPPAE